MQCVILVPYRASKDQEFRKEQLEQFLPRIVNFMDYKEIPYKIIILEQDNDRLFNKGLLLNIGFKEFDNENTYYVIHNVDLLPKKEDFDNLDYSNVEKDEVRDLFGYSGGLGGITIIGNEEFKRINGYPNNFLLWGYEDIALMQRCKSGGIRISRPTHNKFIEELNHKRDSSQNQANCVKLRNDNPSENGLLNIEKVEKLKENSDKNVKYTFKITEESSKLIFTKIDFLEN